MEIKMSGEAILAFLKEKWTLFATIFVACWLILALDGHALSLPEIFSNLRPIIVAAFIVSGTFAVGGLSQELVKWRRANRRRLNIARVRVEKEDALKEDWQKYQTDAFERLKYLNQEEYKIVRDAVVNNSQSFTGNAVQPALHTLSSKKIISSAPGAHDQIRVPCSFPDWMWAHLQENRRQWIDIETIARLGDGSSFQVKGG